MRTLLFAAIIALLPITANAQWAIGGGIELREEDPETGVNIRIENELPFDAPFVKFRARLQGGFFSEDISVGNVGNVQPDNVDINSFYAGANLLAEVGIPLPVNPYAGVGLGFERLSFDSDAISQVTGGDDSDGSAYIDATVGLKVSLIPLIKPFAEYRYVEPFSDFDGISGNATSFNALTANNRFVFGLLLQF